MDILEKAYPIQKIIKTMEILQFGKNIPQLVGTGSLKSQIYPADFDFMVKIEHKLNNDDSYEEFKKIINNIYKDDILYFIEFKFQDKDGNKHKIFNINDFTKELFSKWYNYNINYCKIDAIIDLDGHFKEVSCIYFFNEEPITQEEYKKALMDDMKSYYNEGKYYKSLKRLLILSKISNPSDKNLIIAISQLFNSMVGKLYQVKNELDASIIFLDKFKDKKAQKQVEIFLNNIGIKGLKLKDIHKISNDYGKLIDGEGLKFYKTYKLKAGVEPKYNSIKGGQKKKIINIQNSDIKKKIKMILDKIKK